jgi:SAM-dependent methyltransferase
MRPNNLANTIHSHDRPIHDWYRFVLSFPPHLVRDYLTDFAIGAGDVVLDPFCGTGTTLIECKKRGIASIGVEANPLAHFVSSVKLDWRPDALGLIQHATAIAHQVHDCLSCDGLDDNRLFDMAEAEAYVAKTPMLRTFSSETERVLLNNTISPIPLHKTLTLLHIIQAQPDSPYRRHEQLGLIACAVREWSNLRFAPEVGIGRIKYDVRVVEVWLEHVRQMAFDLMTIPSTDDNAPKIYRADARQLEFLEADSISAVITSPPYPNEKDYTRATRLEAALLGYIVDRASLRELKQALLRSNTRNVYVHDDDDQWIKSFPRILDLAETIESRRIELGKTSGFERLYGRVTKLYFGGMARHLSSLRRALKPGAMLAYVVGDQASYLQVMIRTGELLAEIAESLGYEVVRIDLFRTRLATATKAQLREEVLILRWRGR